MGWGSRKLRSRKLKSRISTLFFTSSPTKPEMKDEHHIIVPARVFATFSLVPRLVFTPSFSLSEKKEGVE